jgi:manganese oxidase
VKYRIVHGGSEVFHSHHPHSGSIRWQRSPRADQQEHWYLGKDGPVKYPVVRTKSDRVDVEVIGPSEALDLEPECGRRMPALGGRVPIITAMWRITMWRDVGIRPGVQHAYKSAMRGRTSCRTLRELPDRQGRVKKGVSPIS